MKNNFLKFLLFFIYVLIGFASSGCSQGGKIQFYRESALNQTLGNIKESAPKQTITKTNGVVIYKDNTNQQNNGQMQGVSFGPKDVNFDLPMKIK